MYPNRFDQSPATNALKVEERETPKMLHNIGDFVLSPSGKSSAYGASIGIGLGLCLAAGFSGWFWLFIPSFGFVFSGVFGMVMLRARLELFSPVVGWERREYDNPQPAPQPTGVKPVMFDLGNGMPAQKIEQPRPAAYRAWLTAVLENDRTQFSLRQARERGWSDEGYQVLIAQLRECGLLHGTDTRNNAPVVTDNGRILAREWLKK